MVTYRRHVLKSRMGALEKGVTYTPKDVSEVMLVPLIVNFEQMSQLFLMFLSLTLNRQMFTGF